MNHSIVNGVLSCESFLVFGCTVDILEDFSSSSGPPEIAVSRRFDNNFTSQSKMLRLAAIFDSNWFN